MSDLSNKIWAEKFRPERFEDYIFTDKTLKRQVVEWVTDGIFPNLILAGIQGTGKSSLARVLLNEFGVSQTDYMFVDGSVHNKVDDIREKVIGFTNIAPMGDFKVVILEEAHRLTKDAQSALLETIERSSDSVRFIFTTNFPKKLLAPVLSRCQLFTFDQFDEEAVSDRLVDILEASDVVLEDEQSINNFQMHIQTFKPDIRAIISSIQYSYNDGKLYPPSSAIKSGSIDEWERLWSAEKLDKDALLGMVYLADATNYELFYTTIYEKGLHHFEDRGIAVVYISDYLAKAMSASTQGIQSIHLEALLHTLFSEGDE